MIPVCMVKVTFDKIVRMVAVRNCLVSAIGTMFVAFFVSFAIVVRSARCGVFPTYADLMLVNMVTMRVM